MRLSHWYDIEHQQRRKLDNQSAAFDTRSRGKEYASGTCIDIEVPSIG